MAYYAQFRKPTANSTRAASRCGVGCMQCWLSIGSSELATRLGRVADQTTYLNSRTAPTTMRRTTSNNVPPISPHRVRLGLDVVHA
jgi:hypothetical protein